MVTDAAVLLADLGGTNIRFALADPASPMPLRTDSIRRYRVEDFASLADAGRHYLDEIDSAPRQAVFAVAGRVDGDSARITNLPWVIGIDDTRRQLGLDHLDVRNDFEAMSMAVPLLTTADLRMIGAADAIAVGSQPSQTFAIVGPGTGLGVGALLRRDGHYQGLATEGGHVGFAPDGDEEIEVLRRVQHRYGRVSGERLVSGLGLVNLYEALCDMAGTAPRQLSPEAITDLAARDADPQCRQTVEIAAGLLGAIAGDLVLAFGAWDGVYLTGGLTTTLLPWLQRGRFRDSFERKGRFSTAMLAVPTQAVLHPDAGLLGAAAIATLAVGAQLGHGDGH